MIAHLVQKIKRANARKKYQDPPVSRTISQRPTRRHYPRSFRIVIIISAFFVAGAIFYTGYTIQNLSTLRFNQVEGDMTQPPVWEENARLTIVCIGLDRKENDFAFIDYLSVVMLDGEEKKVGILNINTNAVVYIPSKAEYLPVRTLYNVGSVEDGESPLIYINEMLIESFTMSVDRYILTDEEGIGLLTDTLGGIRVENNNEIFDQDNKFTITDGEMIVYGKSTSRYLSVDADGQDKKLERQNTFLKDMMRLPLSPISSFSVLKRKGGIENAIYSNITPDDSRRIISLLRSRPQFILATTDQAELKIDGGSAYFIQSEINEDVLHILKYERLINEQARIEVFNGTEVRHLASETTRFLTNRGFDVIRFGNPGQSPGETTIYVTDRDQFQETITLVQETLGIKGNVKHVDELPFVSTGDIIIVLGEDYEYYD